MGRLSSYEQLSGNSGETLKAPEEEEARETGKTQEEERERERRSTEERAREEQYSQPAVLPRESLSLSRRPLAAGSSLQEATEFHEPSRIRRRKEQPGGSLVTTNRGGRPWGRVTSMAVTRQAQAETRSWGFTMAFTGIYGVCYIYRYSRVTWRCFNRV